MKNKTQKERLLHFGRQHGMTQKDIEKATGISHGTLCHNKGEFTTYILGKVFKAFPNLNNDWLINGNGSMLKDPSQTFNVNMGENQQVGDGNTIISGDTDARVRALEHENSRLKQQIAKLEGMVEVYKGMIGK